MVVLVGRAKTLNFGFPRGKETLICSVTIYVVLF